MPTSLLDLPSELLLTIAQLCSDQYPKFHELLHKHEESRHLFDDASGVENQEADLQHLSSVNKRLREICFPLLFETFAFSLLFWRTDTIVGDEAEPPISIIKAARQWTFTAIEGYYTNDTVDEYLTLILLSSQNMDTLKNVKTIQFTSQGYATDFLDFVSASVPAHPCFNSLNVLGSAVTTLSLSFLDHSAFEYAFPNFFTQVTSLKIVSDSSNKLRAMGDDIGRFAKLTSLEVELRDSDDILVGFSQSLPSSWAGVTWTCSSLSFVRLSGVIIDDATWRFIESLAAQLEILSLTLYDLVVTLPSNVIFPKLTSLTLENEYGWADDAGALPHLLGRLAKSPLQIIRLYPTCLSHISAELSKSLVQFGPTLLRLFITCTGKASHQRHFDLVIDATQSATFPRVVYIQLKDVKLTSYSIRDYVSLVETDEASTEKLKAGARELLDWGMRKLDRLDKTGDLVALQHFSRRLENLLLDRDLEEL